MKTFICNLKKQSEQETTAAILLLLSKLITFTEYYISNFYSFNLSLNHLFILPHKVNTVKINKNKVNDASTRKILKTELLHKINQHENNICK